MGFLSDITKDSSSFLSALANSDNNPEEALPVELQDYATDLARTLKGPDTQPIGTVSQLNDLDKTSSMQLLQEADAQFEQDTVDTIISGKGDVKTVMDAAKGMAAFNLEATSDEGIPAASAISAEIQNMAEAEVDNPELAALPIADKIRNEEINSKYSAAQYSIMTMPEGGTWSKIKSVGNKIVPLPGFLDQRSYQDLLKAIGTQDSSKMSSAENIIQFRGILMTILKDERVSSQDVPGVFNALRQKMLEAGGNPADIKSLFTKAFIDYDPASETFYDYLDAVAAIPVVKAATVTSKAAIAGKAAFKAASKGLAKEALAYVNPVPFTDELVIKGTKQVVKASVNTADNVSKALRNRNRVKAADAVIEAIGVPTDTANPFRVLDEKVTYERGLDTAVKPEAFMEPSVANDAYVSMAKMDKALEGKIELIKKTASHLKELKKEAWETVAKSLENTLKMEDIVGVGKSGIGDLVKAYQEGNVQMTREGNLVATLTAQKSFDSIIENGLDTGLAKAQELGRALSGNYEGTKVGFHVEKYAGKWYTKVDIDTQKGWGTVCNDYLRGSGKAAEKWRSFASSLATVTSNPSDIRMTSNLRNIDANIISSTGEAAKRSFESLDKNDKKLVQAFADVGIRYNAFYTPSHLRARGVSEKAIKAYEDYRLMNDLDAFLVNLSTREDLVARGAKKISFNGESIEGVGRVVPLSSASDLINKVRGTKGVPARDIMLDNIKGDLLSADTFTDKQLEYLFSKGYKLIEGSLSPEVDEFKASSFYYLLNPEQTVVNDLGEFVTTYVAGGRRFFDRKGGFLKQLKMGESAKGRRTIVGVNTFAADRDFIGLEREGAALEKIRVAYCKNDMTQVDRLISETMFSKAPFSNHIEFGEWAVEQGLDVKNIDNTLEVLENGSLMRSYDRLKSSADVDDYVGLENMSTIAHRSHFQALSQEAKMTRRRRTGKELFDFDFDVAQPVDIEQQMRYLVNDMVYSGVMKDFSDIYAERFAKTFGSVIAVPGVDNPTPIEMLLKGRPIKGLSGAYEDLAASAETALKNYAAIRGIPSDFDAAIARNATALLNWVGGCAEDVLKLNEDISHKARLQWEKFSEMDAQGFARAYTSHMYLGWFNISQLYKQMSADAYVLAVEPWAAIKAARWSFPFASALRKSDGSLLKALDKLATKFGDAPEAVRIDFENMIKMGVYEHGVGGGLIEAGQTTKSLLNKISMAPFNFGEMHNRTLAYLTALHSLGYHGKKLTTGELAKAATKGQALFMNMDAPGMSRLQSSNLGKTLTQFMGFRMRWFETILFDRELTRTQKWRLGLTTAALVGGEGMLGVKAWSGLCNVYNNYFGNAPDTGVEDRSEAARLAARGVINYLSEELGIDMDLSAALNIDAEETYDKIFGFSLLDLPAVSALSKSMRGIFRGAEILKEAVTGELTADKFEAQLEVLARQSELPSSLNRGILAALLWKNGNMFNSKGQLTDRANSTLRKVLYTLGFNSLSQKDVAKAFSELNYSNSKVKAVEDQCKLLISEYGRGNTEAYNMCATIVQNAGLNQRQLLELWKDLDRSAYDSNHISITESLTEKQIEKGTGTNLIQKERRAYQKHTQQGEE